MRISLPSLGIHQVSNSFSRELAELPVPCSAVDLCTPGWHTLLADKPQVILIPSFLNLSIAEVGKPNICFPSFLCILTHPEWNEIGVFLPSCLTGPHPEWNETGAVSYSLASLGGSSKGVPGCGIYIPWANWNTVLPQTLLCSISHSLWIYKPLMGLYLLSTDLNMNKTGALSFIYRLVKPFGIYLLSSCNACT